MFRVCVILVAISHAADLDGSCPAGQCASGETDETGMIQSKANMTQVRRHEHAKVTPNSTEDCQNQSIVPGTNAAIELVYDDTCPGLGCFESYPCRYCREDTKDFPACKKTAALATKKAHVRRSADMDEVWEQLRGAVEIDQIKEKLQSAHAEAKAKLEEQLAALEEGFPAFKEIKEKFSAKWENITNAVNEEELMAMIEDAKKKGSETLEKLQASLNDMIKNGVDIDKIKGQAQAFWEENKMELPDIDELKGHLQKIGGQTKDLIDGALKDLTSSDQWKSITDAASNAWDTVTGWFR